MISYVMSASAFQVGPTNLHGAKCPSSLKRVNFGWQLFWFQRGSPMLEQVTLLWLA